MTLGKEIHLSEIKCPDCEGHQITLASWAMPTKWDSVEHGIEGTCLSCDTTFDVTEVKV